MHGGKRNGAGRPKSSVSARNLAVIAEAEASGEMPIAFMLKVMRNENAPDIRRDRMARAAAAYLYPKFGAITEAEDNEAGSNESAAPTAEAKANGQL